MTAMDSMNSDSCVYKPMYILMRAVYSAVQGNDIDSDTTMSAIYSMDSNGCVYLPMYITTGIRHLFGLGGWVGGSPSILSLFGFSEMSDNCRPPLTDLPFAKSSLSQLDMSSGKTTTSFFFV